MLKYSKKALIFFVPIAILKLILEHMFLEK